MSVMGGVGIGDAWKEKCDAWTKEEALEMARGDPAYAARVMAQAACYLEGRLQSRAGQRPGRKPDMSEEAAAAMVGALWEVAAEADAGKGS